MAGYSSRVGRQVKPGTDFEALWEALDRVPEGTVGEIVAGEVVTLPRPGALHTFVASGLGAVLAGPLQFGLHGPGGWVILDEPRIRFGDDVRVPDLAGWRADRFDAPADGPFTVVPDWICEVLSES